MTSSILKRRNSCFLVTAQKRLAILRAPRDRFEEYGLCSHPSGHWNFVKLLYFYDNSVWSVEIFVWCTTDLCIQWKYFQQFATVSKMPQKPYVPISKYCKECQPKAANRYLRWNLLFTFLILIFLSSPIWMTLIPYLRRASMEFTVGSLACMQIMWLVAATNAIRWV